MIGRFFKRNGTHQAEVSHPALTRLMELGAQSAQCTVVRTADGRETRDEVGAVDFYRRHDRLFTRDQALYLAHPEGYEPGRGPFSGRGEILRLRFYHDTTPYSVNCQVLQRVRFSNGLLDRLEPRVELGYKLAPVSNVVKNENRRSLRFAHIRGVRGPQVFPHFHFDVFVERADLDGLARGQALEVRPLPGDVAVPEAVRACRSAEELVGLFYDTLRHNPAGLRDVHVSRLTQNGRSDAVELADLGHAPVLGLKGDAKERGAYVCIRRPDGDSEDGRKRAVHLEAGNDVLLRYIERDAMSGRDLHYQWMCRVFRGKANALALRPQGVIRRQTGLPVLLRDFGVGGVGLQNSPLLESYLTDGRVLENPDELRQCLEGAGLLLHFYPRVQLQEDAACYRPRVPAAFSILGEIVRGRVDKEKDEDRVTDWGVTFRYDPGGFDPKTLEVTSWEPIRELRENANFKEIHRALNAFLAYQEREG